MASRRSSQLSYSRAPASIALVIPTSVGRRLAGTLSATPAVPSLMDVAVMVWSCPLDLPESTLLELAACLPKHERREAERRRDPLERRRWLTARAWRRQLLAAHLGSDACALTIVADERGKPRLDGDDAGLRFSTSRSEDLALVACSLHMEVGVDIEAISPRTDVEGFAARFLSASEQRALATRAAGQRRTALFDCWTRKEAYLKATGTGLSVAPATVEVWAGDDRPVIVSGWAVHSLVVAPGFTAAVSGSGRPDWTPSGPHKPNLAILDD
jgi:4'-phosphopantetheinyl transferase